MRPLCQTLILFMLFFYAETAFAMPEERLAGTITATAGGRTLYFPTLKTDIDTDIQGDIATVTVTQTFANPSESPLNATYLFPLNKDAAVYAMTMQVGDETIRAVIQKKEQAEQTFRTAKREGKAASLLTQHRPNMFTQKIANLMPGLPVKVTLHYVQAVPRVDEAYELVIPLVVGPRYQPAGAGESPGIQDGEQAVAATLRSDTPFGQWELEALPDYPDVGGVSIPDTIDPARVGLRVTLQAGQRIASVVSRTHTLAIEGEAHHKVVTLQAGRTIDNRDFVLRYQLAGAATQAGLLTSRKNGQGYFSLLLEPPSVPSTSQITAREMVFVLDTSGSMSGEPLAASKRFMQHAVRQMRPDDSFRIIRFSNHASEFTRQPVPATPENIRRGLAYIESLQADGGTEAMSAIEQSFAYPEPEGALRIVVFLTDGYIGNEASVLQAISQKRGNARIYAFGVGTGVNRFLLSEMGRQGKGFARFIDPTEHSEEVAVELARKLNAPVLTDIALDWGSLNVSDVTPSVIPDLFAGDSIRIQGKFYGAGAHTVKVRGKIQGHAASLPVPVTLPEESAGGESIPLIWARSQIADAMRELNQSEGMRESGEDDSALKRRVTSLGLEHALATRWTSFVAVSENVYNTQPETAQDAHVPLHQVKGITPKAYGTSSSQVAQAYGAGFAGNSVPEPATTGGLMVLGGAGLAALRRRRKTGRKASPHAGRGIHHE